MSQTQQTLDAFTIEQPEEDTEIEQYVVASPELPTTIGRFSLRREDSFKENHAVRYEDGDGRWARAYWDDESREALVETTLDGTRKFVRSDGSVGSVMGYGSASRNHGGTVDAFDALVSFLRGRVE